VVVKFNVPSTCSLSDLIVDLVTHIGLEAEQGGGGSEMLLRAWNRLAKETGCYSLHHNHYLVILSYSSQPQTVLFQL
jgi:hypothetical protein